MEISTHAIVLICLYENDRPTSNVQRPTSNNDVASLPQKIELKMTAEYYLIFMFCCARRAWRLFNFEFQISNFSIRFSGSIFDFQSNITHHAAKNCKPANEGCLIRNEPGNLNV